VKENMTEKEFKTKIRKEARRIVVKGIIYMIITIVGAIIVSSFEPTISAKVAVEQLNGGDLGFANLQAYSRIKEYGGYGCLLLFILLFAPNVIRVIKLSKTKIAEGDQKDEEI
jgi:hypothetical protein